MTSVTVRKNFYYLPDRTLNSVQLTNAQIYPSDRSMPLTKSSPKKLFFRHLIIRIWLLFSINTRLIFNGKWLPSTTTNTCANKTCFSCIPEKISHQLMIVKMGTYIKIRSWIITFDDLLKYESYCLFGIVQHPWIKWMISKYSNIFLRVPPGETARGTQTSR